MFRSLILIPTLCTLFSLGFAQKRAKCRPKLTTEQRCDNPPVVKDVTLTSYLGKWYQTFTSGSAGRFSSNRCVTANYTLVSENPFQIAVLNCQLENGSVPSCVRANATKRANAAFDSQLQVQFFPQLPPERYSIAALIGFPNTNYFAAAVYGCDRFPPTFQPSDGFFIISRTPYAPSFVLKRLIRQLRCNGYKDINYRSFQASDNSKECSYFDGPNSFTISPPNASFAT